MADYILGDVVARLRADTAQFNQALADIQQRLGQLNQGQASLRQQQAQSIQVTQQQTQQFRGVAQALQQTTQATEHATSAWRTMLSVAGGVGIATGFQALIGQMKNIAVETVHVGARMEQLRASFSALAGSTAAGQQQFDQLFQAAQRLGVPFESLARGWRTLTAAATQAGLPISDQRRLLEAIATEGRRVGASNEELSRAFLAMGQMASKGTVSMEELRQQLGEAIPTALAAMAQGMGRTTEELIKLVEAGGVRFPTAARALTRGLEEMQRQGGATGDTLTTAFNRFGNEVIRARDELMRMGGPLKTATQIATDFLKTLNDSAQAQRQLAEARGEEARIGTGLRGGDIARLPADQQRRLTQLNRLLAEQTLAQGDPNAPPMFQPTREEYIQQLKAERDAIYAGAQAVKAKNDEQRAATAVTNKARAEAQLQTDTVADLTKQMDALTKAEATFRREAAQTPELYGRERGTLEEQEKFLKERQERLRSGLQKLTTSAADIPAGVTLPPETMTRLRQFGATYGEIEKAVESLDEKQKAAAKAEREAEQARARAVREQQHDAEQYQTAIDKARMSEIQQREDTLRQLQRITAAYTQTKEARDADTVSAAAAKFSYDEEIQTAAQAAQASIDLKTAYEAEVEALKERFTALKQNADAMRTQEAAAEAMTQRIEDTLERLRLPREERLEDRLRDQARKQRVTLTADDEARLRAISQQEYFNRIMERAERIGDQFAQTITDGLMRIVDGTERVGEGFQNMAKSILNAMAQLALNEGLRRLIGLGLSAIGGYFAPTSGLGGESSAAVGAGINPRMFAGGGVVNRPTLALIGENPSTNPEIILNKPQYQALMRSAMQSSPSAGGQAMGGANVSIINVSSKADAERVAAQERALGRQVVLNYITDDLSQGDGSRINRILRASGR